MFSYFELIKRLYTEEEFELLIENKPIPEPWDWKKIDVSPGSGFHHRVRKPRKKK